MTRHILPSCLYSFFAAMCQHENKKVKEKNNKIKRKKEQHNTFLPQQLPYSLSITSRANNSESYSYAPCAAINNCVCECISSDTYAVKWLRFTLTACLLAHKSAIKVSYSYSLFFLFKFVVFSRAFGISCPQRPRADVGFLLRYIDAGAAVWRKSFKL